MSDFFLQTSALTIFLKFLRHIYYINKSRYQKFQSAKFLPDAIFFDQLGPFKRLFLKKNLPSMKSEYFVLLPHDTCCSLQSFAATALKTKKL